MRNVRRHAAGALGRLWDDPDFRTVRAVIYIATFALGAFMLLADPFEYLCNQPDYSCPGCGFKTGLTLLLRFDVGGAMRSNPLCLAAPVLIAAAIADLIHLIHRQILNRKESSDVKQPS